MARNRQATARRLVDAVGAVLVREGGIGLGVNAVAREAKVDKALIYRYFSGFETLLEAYAHQSDLWWTVPEIIGDHLPVPAHNTLEDWCALALERQVVALRNRPATQEVLAWELVESNALTRALSELREARTRDLVRQLLAKVDRTADTRLVAVHGLLSSAAVYLVLRARKVDTWLGADFAGDAGWRRLDMACRGVVTMALAEPAPAR